MKCSSWVSWLVCAWMVTEQLQNNVKTRVSFDVFITWNFWIRLCGEQEKLSTSGRVCLFFIVASSDAIASDHCSGLVLYALIFLWCVMLLWLQAFLASHALPWVLMTHCSGHSHTHFHISVATLWFLLIIWCSYLIWRSLAFIHFLLSKSSILGSGFFKPPLHWAASFLPVLPQTGSEVH